MTAQDLFFNDDLFADNSFTNDILADNILVGDAESCVQAPGRLKARENFCVNPAAPTTPRFTKEDERVRTAEEVDNYWCASNPRQLNINYRAVCSTQAAAGPFEEALACTLSQSSLSPLPFYKMNSFLFIEPCLVTGLTYLLCPNDKVYCCYSWLAPESPDIDSVDLSPSSVSPCSRVFH